MDVLRAAVPAMDDTTRAVVQNASGQGAPADPGWNLADSIDKEDAVLEGDEANRRRGCPATGNRRHLCGDRGSPHSPTCGRRWTPKGPQRSMDDVGMVIAAPWQTCQIG